MTDQTALLDAQVLEQIAGFDLQQRLQYLVKEVVAQQMIWILTDEHGCVMLNSEDEDCVPVWPHQELAQAWASGEWQACKAEGIPLKKWQSHWTPGLLEDELALVIFPSLNEEGQVLYPDEFALQLNNQLKKHV